MDLDSVCFLFVFMFSLLGTARFSGSGTHDCQCPEVPRKNLTNLPPQTCFQENSRFRYTCVEGYVRKAGTSNLIRCIKKDDGFKWTGGSLTCIPDPKRPLPPEGTDKVKTSQRPESTTVSTPLFTTWHVVTSQSPLGKSELMLKSKGIIAMGLCLPLLVMCTVIVLSCLLYTRWNRRTIQPHTPDEMVPMNVSSGVAA